MTKPWLVELRRDASHLETKYLSSSFLRTQTISPSSMAEGVPPTAVGDRLRNVAYGKRLWHFPSVPRSSLRVGALVYRDCCPRIFVLTRLEWPMSLLHTRPITDLRQRFRHG